jgi:hypothetical protein
MKANHHLTSIQSKGHTDLSGLDANYVSEICRHMQVLASEFKAAYGVVAEAIQASKHSDSVFAGKSSESTAHTQKLEAAQILLQEQYQTVLVLHTLFPSSISPSFSS